MDKAARVSAAMTEECWLNAGKSPGLEIWRVHNKRTENDNADFGIERVPEDEYRYFYRGDSYILLYTYQEQDDAAFRYNVHFWIGSQSTADEYGVAAYKTVELDDLLDGVPVQYREMEGFESDLFLSYFAPCGACPGGITLLEGGHTSGFRHVAAAEFKPRLFWVRQEGKQKKQMISSEIPCVLSSLNSGDCFILDSGSKIYVYRGDASSPFEKNKAIETANALSQVYSLDLHMTAVLHHSPCP
jgi:gelsolin